MTPRASGEVDDVGREVAEVGYEVAGGDEHVGAEAEYGVAEADEYGVAEAEYGVAEAGEYGVAEAEVLPEGGVVIAEALIAESETV